MTTMTTTFPGRPLTRADWDVMPEHHRKTELLDGELVEMPVPKMIHQDLAAGLYDLLKPVLPADHKVRFAPVAVHISDRTILEPDLIVGRRDLFLERGFEEPPLLVVEVLSPSTRRRDLVRKFDWFRQFGIPFVWFADPEEPSVIAYELVDGHYAEVGQAIGEETLRIERPFRVEVTPQRLLED